LDSAATEPQISTLVAGAREARLNAYAPYSGLLVGAAVLAGGRMFVGANVENASYPLSMCAERNAVAAAVASGETVIDAIVVIGGEGDPTPPCGGCRQVLHEFGPTAIVVAESLEEAQRRWRVTDLLPDAFDSSLLD
jgi:cytidine deaminase